MKVKNEVGRKSYGTVVVSFEVRNRDEHRGKLTSGRRGELSSGLRGFK